ncbi:MAG: hypothetical protein HY321_16255, partial [Armatimonadetes bacterium]|nr:hypothetical protein [Armatimonadota bacterium]
MNITRRGLLTGIGAGLAGMKAGAGYKKLIPFVLPPDDIIPGVATWYASACRECPAGCGVLLRNREGRVVKIEGNPLHPINQGKLCARGQAALQGLYDPDRIPAPRRRTASGEWQDTTWEDALRELGVTLRGARRVGIISDLQTGALGNLLQWWVVASGGSPGEPLAARGSDYLIYEPLNYEPLRTACEAVFVRKGIPDYRIDRADFLISFGADFLETWLSPVQLTRRFAEMRQVRAGKRARFVYVGPRRSPTATRADRYIQVAPGAEWLAAQAMLAAMGRGGDVDAFAAQAGVDAGVIRQLAREFQEAKAPLALGGSALPVGEDAAATAAVMLQRARFSSAIDHDRPHALSGAATMAETRAFLQRAAAGEFDTILILNANPVYSLPPDLKAAEALGKAKTVICLNTVEDETVAQVGTWALPINAPAESWGDYEPQAGIHTLMQPAMGTYFQSREAGDVLVQLARAAGVALSEVSDLTSFYDYLRYRWQGLQPQVGNTARLGRSQGPGIGAPGIGNTRLASGAAPLSVLPDAETLPARVGGRPMAPETGISNARYPD